MNWWGKETVEAVKGAVTGTIESINYALSGDLPPEIRVKLQESKVKLDEISAGIKHKVLDIVLVDAKSSSKFQSWWRPALGWLCVVSLSAYFIPQFVMGAIFWFNIVMDMSHAEIIKNGLPIYPVKSDAIFELVLALLGMGTLRTIERFGGVGK